MLKQVYSPMTIRFFILQAHYRSPLDFSNEALQGSEKGLMRLLKTIDDMGSIKPGASSSINVVDLVSNCDKAMKDDMNTPVLIAHLFDGVKWINGLSEGRHTITSEDLEKLKALYHDYVYSILGLSKPEAVDPGKGITNDLVEMILQLRSDAKSKQDFETADRIRNGLTTLGITVKDRKDGADWEIH